MEEEKDLLTEIQESWDEKYTEGYEDGQKTGFLEAIKFMTSRYVLMDKGEFIGWVEQVVLQVKSMPQGIDGSALMTALEQQLQPEEEYEYVDEETEEPDYGETLPSLIPEDFVPPSIPAIDGPADLSPPPPPVVHQPPPPTPPAEAPAPAHKKKVAKKKVAKKRSVAKKKVPVKKKKKVQEIIVAPDIPTSQRTPGVRRSKVVPNQAGTPQVPKPKNFDIGPGQRSAPPPAPQGGAPPPAATSAAELDRQIGLGGGNVNW